MDSDSQSDSGTRECPSPIWIRFENGRTTLTSATDTAFSFQPGTLDVSWATRISIGWLFECRGRKVQKIFANVFENFERLNYVPKIYRKFMELARKSKFIENLWNLQENQSRSEDAEECTVFPPPLFPSFNLTMESNENWQLSHVCRECARTRARNFPINPSVAREITSSPRRRSRQVKICLEISAARLRTV